MDIRVPGFSDAVPAGDKSAEILRSMFGGVGEVGGSLSVLSDLFSVFNASLLSLGSVLAFYLIFTSVIQTAHDGSVLGKRYSSMWVPIRSLGAAALLVPAFGGFSGIQALVLSVAMGGISVADKMASAGVDAMMSKGGFTAPIIPQSKTGEALSKDVFKIAACMTANERAAARAGSQFNSTPRRSSTLTNTQITEYGLAVDGMWFPCGEVSVAEHKSGKNDAVRSAIQGAQVQAASELYAAAKLATDSIGPTKTNFDYAGYRAQAVAKHDAALTTALQAASRAAQADSQGQYRGAVEKIKQEGWISLGGSAFTLARMSSEVSQAVQLGTVEAASSNSTLFGSVDDGRVRAEVAMILSTLNAGSDEKIETKSAAKGNEASSDGMDSSLVSKAMGAVIDTAFEGVKLFTKSTNGGNVLLDVKALGDRLMDSAAVMALGALGMSIGPMAVLTGGAVMAFVAPWAIGFSLVGGMLGVWVPMYPWLVGIMVAVAFFIAVFEAVVAAPIWLLMFFNGEGDGLREGDSAWKFLAATLLRPSLTVLSFFAGSILVAAVGAWVIDSFVDMAQALNSRSLGGLIGLFGYMVVFTSVMVLIVHKCFGLMLDAPEAILRWLGSTLTGTSDDTGAVQQNNALIMQHAGSAAKGAAGGVAGAVGAAAKGAGAPKAENGSDGGKSGGVEPDTHTGAFNTANSSYRPPMDAGGVSDAVDKSSKALPMGRSFNNDQ